MNVQALLSQLDALGVKLSARGDKLHCRAPDGVMTPFGTLGGEESGLTDINASGWSVGSAMEANGNFRGIRVEPPPSVAMS